MFHERTLEVFCAVPIPIMMLAQLYKRSGLSTSYSRTAKQMNYSDVQKRLVGLAHIISLASFLRLGNILGLFMCTVCTFRKTPNLCIVVVVLVAFSLIEFRLHENARWVFGTR